MSDADPLALKPGGPHVTGTVVTKDLPGSGKFYRVAFKPGGGGYPGASLAFDAPLNFSKHDVLAVWFKIDAPILSMQLSISGADGVVTQYDLIAMAAAGGFRLQIGVWYRAFIPYKAEPGWVRFGKQVDTTKIKSLTFIGWDEMMLPARPTYEFTFGGMALMSMDEAKAAFPRTLHRAAPGTAARLLKNDELLVWTADASEKIYRDSPLPRNAGRAAAASAKSAGNEYASLLLVAKPSRDIKNVAAEVSDLTCGANRVSATNVTIRYVDFIPGLFWDSPDPLPLLNGKNLSVRAGENLQIWATVYVPPGTPKGLYRGQITLKDAGRLNQRLPIQIEVYGFSLSTKTHLKSLYTINHTYPEGSKSLSERSERYWGQKIEPFSKDYVTLMNNVIRDYGEHRTTPELFVWMGWLSDADRLALHRRYGFDPMFMIYYNLVNAYLGHETMSSDERAKIITSLKAEGEKRKNTGVAELTAIKIADEPNAESMKAVLMAAQDAKTAIPYIQSFITINSAHLPEQLYGLVDTWNPMWNVFDFDGSQARARRAVGDRFWAYAAEYKTNDGYEPLDLRVPYWLYWKYEITGVHHSHGDNKYSLLYPNATYPHSDGLEEIPSIRWEMIRHGVQDYEYLCLLNNVTQKNGKKAERYRVLLHVPKSLAENDKEYTNDVRVLQARRNEIAHAIEKLTE